MFSLSTFHHLNYPYQALPSPKFSQLCMYVPFPILILINTCIPKNMKGNFAIPQEAIQSGGIACFCIFTTQYWSFYLLNGKFITWVCVYLFSSKNKPFVNGSTKKKTKVLPENECVHSILHRSKRIQFYRVECIHFYVIIPRVL